MRPQVFNLEHCRPRSGAEFCDALCNCLALTQKAFFWGLCLFEPVEVGSEPYDLADHDDCGSLDFRACGDDLA